MLKSKKILLLLSITGGLILSLAWPERGFPGFLFVGFVPFLFVEDHLTNNKERFGRFSILFFSYPGFFIWNLLTTWWIVNSTAVGALLAIVLNSLFMSVVFQLFHFSKTRLRNSWAGFAGLIFYWISFEYLHLNWNLNWPWLNLGNGFASYYKWVQWYEYTGAMGGTLWVLGANVLIFLVIRKVGSWQLAAGSIVIASKAKQSQSAVDRNILFRFSLFAFLWIVLPIVFSYFLYSQYKEKKDPYTFVVVQPNLDPYKEQYELPPPEVIGRIMKLGLPLTDSTIDFMVAPESAIQEQMWDDHLEEFSSIQMLRDVIKQRPGLNILIGASTFYEFRDGEPVSGTARKFKDVDRYYDAYNTAILVNSTGTLQTYHKSKLTPGVEVLPSFPGFKWLEKFAIDLGGTVGSLGISDTRKVYSTTKKVKISPVICYESIFGEFYSEFVRNGAQIICIITNDGWWGNTAGYRQHFAFAHLRAIETRRSIVRSANTGISAFIDQRGDAHQSTGYWVPAAIRGTVNANSSITFYTRHGDYIARIAVAFGALLFLLTFVFVFLNRKISLA
jgi:apolipoprotein N-acyltransferase